MTGLVVLSTPGVNKLNVYNVILNSRSRSHPEVQEFHVGIHHMGDFFLLKSSLYGIKKLCNIRIFLNLVS